MSAVKYLSDHKVIRQALKNETIENFKAHGLEVSTPFSLLIRAKLQDFLDNKFDIRSIQKRKLEFVSVKIPNEILHDLKERASRHDISLCELIRIVLEYEPTEEELQKLKKNSFYFKDWKQRRRFTPVPRPEKKASSNPEPSAETAPSSAIADEPGRSPIGDFHAPFDMREESPETLSNQAEEKMYPIGVPADGALPSAVLDDRKCTCDITLDPCPIHDIEDEDAELEEAMDE